MPAPIPDRVKLALETYAGPLNCAQSVATAFQDLTGLTPEQIASHSHNGGGRAPGGLCGALYAGLEVFRDDILRQSVTAQFTAITGSSQCREIRQTKRTSCAACVETAAALVTKALNQDAANHSQTAD